MSQDNFIPQEWGQSAQIDGLDLVDKQTLLDEPFRILGVAFRHSSTNGALLVEIDAERVDGTTFSFNDSSTGVKEQIVGYLASIGKDFVVEQESEYLALSETEKLVIPRGLRVSEYEVDIRNPAGRVVGRRKARTYYLTASGARSVGTENSAKAAAKPARKTAS